MTSSVPPQTPDPHFELLRALRDLVPSAFLDDVLDHAALLDAIGAAGEDGAAEPPFAFTWPGLERGRSDARQPTSTTLVTDEEASVDWEGAKDVLIEGDNLQVLKLLKNAYTQQVKLIYIDPPYNTGESFTYNDKYAVSERQYLTEFGQIDEQGKPLSSRIETRGRKHAPWLTMMFPRLVLGRHLLRRDGIFLASIDNNEVHHLRLLLDAVFGAENFVDMFTWRGARKGDAKLTGGGQDYVLVYARDRAFLKMNDVRWRERKEGLEAIYAKEAELREEYGSDHETIQSGLRAWYKSLADEHPSNANNHYNRIDDRGIWFPDNISSPNYRENLVYDWKGYSPPDNGWRYEKATMERLDTDGRLVYPDDMTMRVQIKSYLHMHEQWAPPSVFYRDRRAASKKLEELMGTKVFDDPKATDVLARLFHSMTDEGDLILDFFAGSGSSGHAVWEQNSKDGKNRNWIMVQQPEAPDDSENSGKNAINEGYATIFDITAERMRRARNVVEGADEKNLAFRIFRLRESTLEVQRRIVATDGMTSQSYLQQLLDDSADSPVVAGAKDIDVVWEVVLKSTDTRLDSRVEAHQIDGVTVYEFTPAAPTEGSRKLFVSLGDFTLATADELGLSDDDTLILRGDRVSDSVTLTLAPRLSSKLILLERVPRDVSL